MRKRLSVAMIVKNESRVIARCLSALEAVQDISAGTFIYDTGSTDGSIEIARALGATVVEGDWPNDFAEARNRSLDLVSTPWVLVVDADEQIVVDEAALGLLLDHFESSGINAGHVAQVNFDESGQEREIALQTRLFRREVVTYRGIVHEVIAPVDGSEIASQSDLVPRDVLHLDHDGYADSAVLREKIRRNAAVIGAHFGPTADVGDPLVLKALVDEGRSLRHLGERGAAYWDLWRVQASPLRTPYRLFGLEILAGMLVDDGQWDDAASIIAEYAGQGGSPSYVRWMRGVSYLRQRRFADAARELADLSVISNIVGGISPTDQLYEARIQAAESLGRLEEALSCQLTMIIGCDRADGQAERLLRLWGSRPLEVLADILRQAKPIACAQLLRELSTIAGPGYAAAQRLTALLQRGVATPAPA